MNELIKMGVSDLDLRCMLDINPDIKTMNEQDVIDKEIILQKIRCSDDQVRDIIASNALLLNRSNEEIIELISYLLSKGFTTLNILFDSNPYILNMEIDDIEEYINNRLKKNESLEDIVDDLDSNPYLFMDI